MKFCQKCGKEITEEAVVCSNCGCAVESKTENKEISYDKCVSGASTTNIISAIVLAVGVVCGLFVSALVGAILCFVAEFLALMPNSKLQKEFKKNTKVADKREYKKLAKQCQKDMKSKYSAYKFSFVLAIIALVALIVFALFI